MTSWRHSPDLRRIVLAYTINRLGTWFGFIAVSLAVYDHTHSALAVAAVLLLGEALPAFVVPALIARVEASRRRGELSQLYFFEAVATTALAILLWRFWLPGVLLLVALDGTAALAASALLRAAAARKARESAVASTPAGQAPDARDDDTEAAAQAAEAGANAALNVAFSATFMLGPALAGLLVGVAGASIALLIDAATFVVCGAMLIAIRPHVEEGKEDSVRARLRAAWTYVNEVSMLRALLIAQAVALVFFAAGGPIEIVYAKATLGAGDQGYGALLAVWGVGTVIGSLLFARAMPRGLGAMLTGGTLAVGLAYIGFSVTTSFALACAAAVLGGLGNGVQWASLIGAVQRLTPPALHGRLMGGVESIGSLSPAVGLALGGALTALTSPQSAFLIAGLGASAMTIVFMRLVRRGLLRPRELQGPAVEGETPQSDASPAISRQLDDTGTAPPDPALSARQ